MLCRQQNMAAPASRQELLSAWASALAEKGAVLEADEADAFLEVVAAPPGAKANDADLAGPPTGGRAMHVLEGSCGLGQYCSNTAGTTANRAMALACRIPSRAASPGHIHPHGHQQRG